MRNYKFALLGYYGFGNLGDELLLQACLELLGSNDVIVLSNNPEETSRNFNIKSINRWKFFQVVKALINSENLLLGGGGLFQDSSSVKSCLWYWGIVRLAKILGVKIFAVSQSIGPLNHKLSKILTKNALRACEKIHVRDENSYNLAKNFGCKNVILGHDLVFMLKPSPLLPFCSTPLSLGHLPLERGDLASCGEGVSKILINLRPCKEVEKYIDIIAPEIRKFNFHKIGVALSKEDEEILNSFSERLSLEKIIRIMNFNDAEKLWTSSACAVGMRLHFGVLSRIFKTPVALIPYDIKVKEFAKSSDIPLIIDEWKEPSMPLEIPDMIKFEPWTSAELTK